MAVACLHSSELPCFGGGSEQELAEEPPPPPPTSDGEFDSDEEDAVTVHDAECRGRDLSSWLCAQDDSGANVAPELLDDVSSAVEFLAQMKPGDAQAVLMALEESRPMTYSQEEAILFVKKLVGQLGDRATVLPALRVGLSRVLVERPHLGRVGGFLSKRRKFRMSKAKVRGNWEEHFTRGNGQRATRAYYYNNATQKTQWDPPPEFQDIEEPIVECEEEFYEDD